jgi:hypothetical protein
MLGDTNSPFADSGRFPYRGLLMCEHEAMGVFHRFHAVYVGRTGVFVAVDHLRRTGRLSEEELVLYALVDDWLGKTFPILRFTMTGTPQGLSLGSKVPLKI